MITIFNIVKSIMQDPKTYLQILLKSYYLVFPMNDIVFQMVYVVLSNLNRLSH